MKSTTTLILGGGFGGISAANSLRPLLPREHEIVVIDKSRDFHIGAGKTWIMLGDKTREQISRPRTDLLVPGIRLVQTEVTRIDLTQRSVAAENETLHWDFLVLALGADLDSSGIPGLVEAGHTFYTMEGAERLRGVLESFAGGDLAILIPKTPFKCPPAPYEAAMLLHHALAARGLGEKARLAIYTVEGAPMPTAGAEMGEYIRGELEQRAIAYHPRKKATRVDGATQRISFEDGSEAGYDLLIAIPPHVAPKVARDAKLTNAAGWIPADPLTLKAISIPEPHEVYAIGDLAVVALPGRYKPDEALALPKAGVFAEAHGRIVAHQIAAKILGRTPDQRFDGKGFCYLEVGSGKAVKGEGSFFNLPHPVMQRQIPDERQFRDKLAWVDNHLRPGG